MEITQGQIWEVVTDIFLVNENTGKFKRKIALVKGEKIEIRFPFAWNFRTHDHIYCNATPDEILKHCELYGVVWSKVKSQNNAQLEEILRLKLFDAHD